MPKLCSAALCTHTYFSEKITESEFGLSHDHTQHIAFDRFDWIAVSHWYVQRDRAARWCYELCFPKCGDILLKLTLVKQNYVYIAYHFEGFHWLWLFSFCCYSISFTHHWIFAVNITGNWNCIYDFSPFFPTFE